MFCAVTDFPLLLFVVHETVQRDVVEEVLRGGEDRQHKLLVATTSSFNNKYRCT